MDYINTSHPNFVGGSKAVEIALQQVKSSRVPLAISRQKVCVHILITKVFCFACFPFPFPLCLHFIKFPIN